MSVKVKRHSFRAHVADELEQESQDRVRVREERSQQKKRIQVRGGKIVPECAAGYDD